jgi:hypothetical protein
MRIPDEEIPGLAETIALQESRAAEADELVQGSLDRRRALQLG